MMMVMCGGVVCDDCDVWWCVLVWFRVVVLCGIAVTWFVSVLYGGGGLAVIMMLLCGGL